MTLMVNGNTSSKVESEVSTISLKYDHADSDASATRLLEALNPTWKTEEGPIEFIRFKDGITNTLFKAVKRRPGWTEHQIDKEAVLLRAYGEGTEVLIDRDREAKSHSVLANLGLAPPLLARFENGLLYRYIEGDVCSPEDLRKPEVWRAVAQRLAQWHAVLPISAITDATVSDSPSPVDSLLTQEAPQYSERGAKTAKPKDIPSPNLWTVMERWINALPTHTPTNRAQQSTLRDELTWTVTHIGDTAGFVFGHCDLLSGNVIVQPPPSPDLRAKSPSSSATAPQVQSQGLTVSFIDYEYATPAPAAFDLANHFAEWGGFECEYGALPTRSQRRDFLHHYLRTFHAHASDATPCTEAVFEESLQRLERDVDRFRGIPGLYWGIWALIQKEISQIDFDYASYAPLRLGEYWGWKRAEGKVLDRRLEGMDTGAGEVTEEQRVREARWWEE